jgi:hypothetical protein
MQLGIQANTKQEIDQAGGMLVYFNCPHDTPEIRANIRGLILCLARPRFYQHDPREGVRKVYTARSLDGIEVHFMSDELLNRGVNSLIEIEFTLKHALAQISKDKGVKFFIDKPGEPAKDADGNWILTDNKSIDSTRLSNLEVIQTTDTGGTKSVSITEALDFGLIDNGPLRSSAYLGELTSAFYKPLIQVVPSQFSDSIYELFRRTLNKQGSTVYEDISWFNLLNRNLSTSFNYEFSNDVAMTSYFRFMPEFMTVKVTQFFDLMNTLFGCLCDSISYIGTISTTLIDWPKTPQPPQVTVNVSPTPIQNTVNVDPTPVNVAPSTPVTVNVSPTPITNNVATCCPDEVQALEDIANAIAAQTKQLGQGTTTTTTNGVTTTKPNDPVYNAIDPQNPSAGTTAPYKATLIKQSSISDAKCGFLFYYINLTADMTDSIAGWLENYAPLVETLGQYLTIPIVVGAISEAPVTEGVSLVKTGQAEKVVNVGLASLYKNGISSLHNATDNIRSHANEKACGNPSISKSAFLSAIAGALGGLEAEWGGFVAMIGSIVYDYYGAVDSASNVVDVNNYAQYCPCPTILQKWTGNWNASAGAPNPLVLVQSGYSLTGHNSGTGNTYFTVSATIDSTGLIATGTYTGYDNAHSGTFTWTLNSTTHNTFTGTGKINSSGSTYSWGGTRI